MYYETEEFWKDAPVGATHYAELTDTHGNAWYKFESGVLMTQIVDAFFDVWVTSSRPVEQLIPKPNFNS